MDKEKNQMSLIPNTKPLQLGTKTKFGKVVGIRSESGPLGERYYFLEDKKGTISFMPSSVVEKKENK